MKNTHISCQVSADYFSSFSVHALYIHFLEEESHAALHWCMGKVPERSLSLQITSLQIPLRGHQKSKGLSEGYHHSTIITDCNRVKVERARMPCH